MGDDSRVRALAMLRDGELCLCQIIDVLGLAPSTVSKHMAILRQAGLIEQRKQGRWHYYRLVTGRSASPAARQAIRWVRSNLDDAPSIAADAKRLCCIRDVDPQQLTRCYRPTTTN